MCIRDSNVCSCVYIHIYIWKHLKASGAIWTHLELSVGKHQTPDTQEAPRRHPEDTQEAPRATNGSREDFDVKCPKTNVFYSKNGAREPFRVDGSDVTLTVPAACAQK